MKKMVLLAWFVFYAAGMASAITIAEIKAQYPDLGGLDDNQVVDALHQAFYQDLTREEIAASLGVTLKPPRVIPKLGPVDKWRFESCQSDAIKSPTPQGVNNGLRLCRERFNQ